MQPTVASVYLKGAWVLHSSSDCNIAKQIHPPIDSILLKALDKAWGTDLSKVYKWQKLDRHQYEQLIKTFRSFTNGGPMWKLEEHWEP